MGNELRHIYPPRYITVNDSSPGLTITQSGSGSGLDMVNKLISNIGAAGTDFSSTGGLTLATDFTISTANGIDINPGSDVDADLITTGVTGAPKLFWDESQNQFAVTVSGLQVANDKWTSGVNNAGSGFVNIFKVNTSDQIDIGAALVIPGNITMPTDGGAVTAIDMSVSATPALGTEESYVFRIDATNILKIYAEANNAGGIQKAAVGFGSTAPVHLRSAQTTAPTTTLTSTTLNDGGGAGASIAVTAGSTDLCGDITITAGNGTPTAGIAGQIVFNSVYTGTPKMVLLTEKDVQATYRGPYISSVSTASFQVSFSVALATSGVYKLYYQVIE